MNIKIVSAILIILILISGCTKTEVIYLDEKGNLNEKKYVLEEKMEEGAVGNSYEKNDSDKINYSEENIFADNQKNNKKVEIHEKKYREISRSDDGVLFIETMKNKSQYSKDEIANILIEAYRDNCEYFKNKQKNYVFLKYIDEFGYTSRLIYYEILNSKTIVIDSQLINKDFKTCS